MVDAGNRLELGSRFLCAKRVEQCRLDIADNALAVVLLVHRLVLLKEESKATGSMPTFVLQILAGHMRCDLRSESQSEISSFTYTKAEKRKNLKEKIKQSWDTRSGFMSLCDGGAWLLCYYLLTAIARQGLRATSRPVLERPGSRPCNGDARSAIMHAPSIPTGKLISSKTSYNERPLVLKFDEMEPFSVEHL